MITFPISLPDARSEISVLIKARSSVGVSSSPFTFEQQVYRHQGQMLYADVSLRPMKRLDAEVWVSSLLSLNGREGTFLMGDPLGSAPRGVGTGTPVVNGASQVGQSLVTAGWTINTTGILKAGDWIQLGSGSGARLYKNLTDVNSNASGVATLDLYPRLRSSPTNGAAIVVNGAKGVWRLASNDTEWSEGLAQMYGIDFSCHEAL